MRQLFLITLISLFSISGYTQGSCTLMSNDFSGFQQGGSFGNPAARSGQTFIACTTGCVTDISIEFAGGSYTDDFNLWLGEATGGLLPTVHQTFSVTTTGEGVMTSISISPPFEVVAGTLYEFQLDITSGTPGRFLGQDSDNIAGEATISGVPLSGGTIDLTYSLNVAPCPNIDNVPTLSQWGALVLGLVLMIFGTLALKFKAQNFKKVNN